MDLIILFCSQNAADCQFLALCLPEWAKLLFDSRVIQNKIWHLRWTISVTIALINKIRNFLGTIESNN